jgi:anti-sigma regulatory factor (Ser/Thr protein kinase)
MDTWVQMRMRLAVEELFVNTVTHGYGGDSDAPIDVTLRIDGNRVLLTYEDIAPAFDPFAKVKGPDAVAPLEARTPGRLGVFLLTQLAEHYTYARNGDRNCITIELKARQTRSIPPGSRGQPQAES